MADPTRARKLADRIQVIVAEMLETRVKDPRLGFVTVTDARVTNDLQQATVFYTVYGDDQVRADTAAALESARGILRSEVGRQTGVRHTPTLAFVADAIPETAGRIDELVRAARAADAAVAAEAARATYAGEADPYRVPRDADMGDDAGDDVDDVDDGDDDVNHDVNHDVDRAVADGALAGDASAAAESDRPAEADRGIPRT